MRYVFVIIGLIALCEPPAVYAANYYVSPLGTDTANCSQSTPCREIRRALQLVSPGDSILVADGSYLGFTVRDTDGTPSAKIRIAALGSNAVILPTNDRGSFEDRDNIFVTFSDYLVIDGLRTFNAPRAGMRIDASHHVEVRNSVFGNNGTWGLFTNHANNVLLEQNEMFGSGDEHGIYISNSGDFPTLRGNRCYNNAAAGIHMNGDLSAGGHGGVVGDGIISNALVEGNIIYGNGRSGAAGINMDGVQDSLIRNNLLYDNHATGIVAYRIDGGAGPKNLLIMHNTIDMANDGRYALQVSETQPGIVIRNNILYNRSSTRGGLAYGTTSDIVNVDSDYNTFGGTAVIAFDGWSIRKTLAEWQAEGFEQNSFTATLSGLFQNASLRNYQLPEGAPTIDTGQNRFEVTVDIVGTIRPVGSRSDIGAYEFPVDTVPPARPKRLRIE